MIYSQRIRLRWLVFGLGVALATTTACKDKESKPAKQAETAEPAPTPRTDRPAVRPVDRAGLAKRSPRRIEPIEVVELTDRFEVPEGGKVLTAPARPKVGERVQATYCFDNKEVAAVAALLEASLKKKGWSPIHVRLREQQPDRAAIASQQPRID